jgi:hypothetical protein
MTEEDEEGGKGGQQDRPVACQYCHVVPLASSQVLPVYVYGLKQLSGYHFHTVLVDLHCEACRIKAFAAEDA